MIYYLFPSTLHVVSAEAEGGLFDFNATLPFMSFQIMILMLILNTLFYHPIENVMHERDEFIRNTLNKTSEILTKADKITTEYELKLNEGRREAQSIITTRQKIAQELSSMEMQKSKKSLADMLAFSISRIESTKKSEFENLLKEIDTFTEQIEKKLLYSYIV